MGCWFLFYPSDDLQYCPSPLSRSGGPAKKAAKHKAAEVALKHLQGGACWSQPWRTAGEEERPRILEALSGTQAPASAPWPHRLRLVTLSCLERGCFLRGFP